MSKEIRCPWCQEETLVTEEVCEKQFGNVKQEGVTNAEK